MNRQDVPKGYETLQDAWDRGMVVLYHSPQDSEVVPLLSQPSWIYPRYYYAIDQTKRRKNMTIEELKKAYSLGETIEFLCSSVGGEHWRDLTNPSWDYGPQNYRVMVAPPMMKPDPRKHPKQVFMPGDIVRVKDERHRNLWMVAQEGNGEYILVDSYNGQSRMQKFAASSLIEADDIKFKIGDRVCRRDVYGYKKEHGFVTRIHINPANNVMCTFNRDGRLYCLYQHELEMDTDVSPMQEFSETVNQSIPMIDETLSLKSSGSAFIMTDSGVEISQQPTQTFTIPTPKEVSTQKENTMLKFETRYFVNGTDLIHLSNEELYNLIARAEKELEELGNIKNRPIRLRKEMAKRQANLDALIAHLDKADATPEAVE